MNNIENTYVNYDELVKYFKQDVIESRIRQIAEEMLAFIVEYDLRDKVTINEMALTHAVLDYFSDIQRLKDYQKIEHVNEYKVKAYETFWLLQRKPIQLVQELEDDKWLYINEKFLLGRLTAFMLKDNINIPLVAERQKAYKSFLDTLYYHLKFRRCDAQSLELMLLAFDAGRLFC